jgi:hypothetical protein
LQLLGSDGLVREKPAAFMKDQHTFVGDGRSCGRQENDCHCYTCALQHELHRAETLASFHARRLSNVNFKARYSDRPTGRPCKGH